MAQKTEQPKKQTSEVNIEVEAAKEKSKEPKKYVF
jgi:hypothetical protein